jgi:SAM-dependent methyltransferase
VNSLAARLDYPDAVFDFIYAISVFTHLTEDLQAPWRDELYRVLKPGGYTLFTFQGSHHQHHLTEGERRDFAAGKLVVQQSRYPGMNTCQVFHPESYVRGLFSDGGDVVDFIPGGATDAGRQDVVIVRRVAG